MTSIFRVSHSKKNFVYLLDTLCLELTEQPVFVLTDLMEIVFDDSAIHNNCIGQAFLFRF